MRPGGVTALSLFFMAGAAISFVAGVSLLFPGSILEPIWRVNPRAHEALASLGGWAVVSLCAVCLMCALAAIGLWRGTRWGYQIAFGILIVNLIGDVANVVLAGEYKAAIGVPIVIAILAFLRSRRVRAFLGV
jgi:hypothetical protein